MRYQIIGNICLIKKKDNRLANRILKKLHHLKSVYYQSKIYGKLRQPKIQWLAGKKGTEVLHKENNCLFKLDIQKVMFSKGNQEEKRRMIKAVKKGDVVVDMFAGIGYWSVPIAKFSNPKMVYSIELNPSSFRWLQENVRINRLSDKVVPILGDSKKVTPTLPRADRIIMGYFDSRDFLVPALKVLKKGGTIYFHYLASEDGFRKVAREIAKSYKLKLLRTRKIKDYAPHIYHCVAELKR